MSIENYRPLSILSTFSKLFERLFCTRLLQFFNRHDLFNSAQHGFRVGRSTSTAIMDFLNDLYARLDRGESCIGIFLDLSKAFDLVNHSRLLDKLWDYGVRGVPLSWLRSYLTGRSQYVEIRGVKSGLLAMNCGVPQGSVIGPLLYIIYTGDINLSNVVMYADDTTILSSGHSAERATMCAGGDVENIASYFKKNDLHINAEKSVYIDFALRPMVTPTFSNSAVIGLNMDKFSVVDSTKFLGVNIDRYLKWSGHIDILCSRIAGLCFAIKRLKEHLSMAVLKMFYFAHVHSSISYGIVAWGSSSEISRVLLLQKRALRCMLGMSRRESCRPVFRRLGIMTVVCVYIYQLCIHVRLFAGDYKYVNESHRYNTRNNLLLEYPYHRTSTFECSPHYMSVRCFNKLPDDVKCLNISAFRKRLNALLISKAYYGLNEFFSDHF